MQTGIENVKPVAAIIANAVTAVANIDSNQDGKIQTVEYFNAAQSIVIKVITNSNIDVQALAKEAQDLDADEKKEIGAVIERETEMPSAKAEQLVERGIKLVVDAVDFVIDLQRPAEEFEAGTVS